MKNNNRQEKYSKVYNILKIVLIVALFVLAYVIYEYVDDYYYEYLDLKESVKNYQQIIADKNKKVTELNIDLQKYKNQIEFMNKYVSICPVDGTSLYHNYSCAHYDKDDPFYVYSINDARAEGYVPCSYCESDTDVETSKEAIVYITNTGSKYHRAGCSYLKSKNAITKEDAILQGYSPCSRCNP